MMMITRRGVILGAPFVLAGCQTMAGSDVAVQTQPTPAATGDALRYGAITAEPWHIPAVDITKIDRRYLRQSVRNVTGEPPGKIVVDTANKFLYYTQEDGMALRYGVGVGRDGFEWAGRAIIDRKQEWPRWHPPKEMMERDPEAAKWPNGMPGGIDNPLGARALYLAQNGKDTLYRIHGTNQPWSIGQSLSSGCIRLFNQDIIDLYNRVPINTEVVVSQSGLAA